MITKQKNVSYTLPPCTELEIDCSAKFLTLDPKKYPDFASVPTTIFADGQRNFTAAEFYRNITIPEGKNPTAHICVFADTKFRLSVNGEYIGTGPVAAGGDYGNSRPMPKQYYNRYEIKLQKSPSLEILCEVQTPGLVMTDYSCGKGCLVFSCKVTYDDREPFDFVSDESWLCRQNPRYESIGRTDLTLSLPDWEQPTVIPEDEILWNLVFADIPMLEEEIKEAVCVTEGDDSSLSELRFEFERIFSAYIIIEAENPSQKPLDIEIFAAEYLPDTKALTSSVRVGTGKSVFREFVMRSVGEVCVRFDKSSGANVKVKLAYAHYPYDRDNVGVFECSDKKLGDIWKLGRTTLVMCRQTLHLDSPLHQETLGCAGDYAIESLLTHMTYGDMRLTRLDLIRIADFMQLNGGVMFHTSYSLIWISMLYDYYLFTGDKETAGELLPTVKLMLELFGTYTENGVIENPPNYMFIDWGQIDGYNMHHPPKALGQTSMNAFYHRALKDSALLYKALGQDDCAKVLEAEAESLKQACRERFYDEKLHAFRDGDSAPLSVYQPNEWLPENSSKTYHTRQANILALWSGLIDGDEALGLLEAVAKKESLDGKTVLDVQPYFMHYLLEAVRLLGKFDDYGLSLIHMWDKQRDDSPKGMKEGWNAFNGDCSHAWGASPTYQLPMAFSGFEMLKAGFECFRLAPKLFGLDNAYIELPTPKGKIKIMLKEGCQPEISLPEGFIRIGADTYSDMKQ